MLVLSNEEIAKLGIKPVSDVEAFQGADAALIMATLVEKESGNGPTLRKWENSACVGGSAVNFFSGSPSARERKPRGPVASITNSAENSTALP